MPERGMMQHDLQELYEARAEWADLESEVNESRKYIVTGGWLDRVCVWILRISERERAEIQAEITQAQDAKGETK
jgi:hypothetical protein